jgi:hypothetical protein
LSSRACASAFETIARTWTSLSVTSENTLVSPTRSRYCGGSSPSRRFIRLLLSFVGSNRQNRGTRNGQSKTTLTRECASIPAMATSAGPTCCWAAPSPGARTSAARCRFRWSQLRARFCGDLATPASGLPRLSCRRGPCRLPSLARLVLPRRSQKPCHVGETMTLGLTLGGGPLRVPGRRISSVTEQ